VIAAWRYERRHPEIFNPVEQTRLRAALERAGAEIRGGGDRPRRALDFGTGGGNLTAHLLDLGFHVTAADVSPAFLRAVRRRFHDRPLATLELNGVDLAGVPDGSFDLVAAYSVLHHVADYLRIVEELARVTRRGGVVVLDHEANSEFWPPDGCAHHFRQELLRHQIERPGVWNPARRVWQRYMIPAKYVHAVRLRIDPAYFVRREGDIHVWPEDRIEWDRILDRLAQAGCRLVWRDDYLNYHAGYPDDLYAAWRDRGCTDMSCVVARRE
jgi:SAM-dependent methyltransferase